MLLQFSIAVIQATSFDPDTLKAEMEGHRERAAASCRQ
jgi:hypothetical protein